MGILSRAVGAALRGGAVVVALLATSAAFFLAGSAALVEYYGSAFITQRPGAVPLRTLRGLDLLRAELKGSIGEGPNHSNHSNHSNSKKIGIVC